MTNTVTNFTRCAHNPRWSRERLEKNVATQIAAALELVPNSRTDTLYVVVWRRAPDRRAGGGPGDTNKREQRRQRCSLRVKPYRPSLSSPQAFAESRRSAAASLLAQYKVIRRNGAVVGFEPAKISVAMTKAFLAVNGGQGAASARIRELVAQLTDAVVGALHAPPAAGRHVPHRGHPGPGRARADALGRARRGARLRALPRGARAGARAGEAAREGRGGAAGAARGRERRSAGRSTCARLQRAGRVGLRRAGRRRAPGRRSSRRRCATCTTACRWRRCASRRSSPRAR